MVEYTLAEFCRDHRADLSVIGQLTNLCKKKRLKKKVYFK